MQTYDVTLDNAGLGGFEGVFDTSYANFLSRIKTNAENPGAGRTFVLRLGTSS